MDPMPRVKEKPASHEYRVSTDAVRAEYRERRAAASIDLLTRRSNAAADLASQAAVRIPAEQGFLVCSPGTFDVAAVVAAALETVESVNIEEKKAEANKSFMTKLGNMKAMTLESPFLQFAMRPEIVASAAAYLGMVPIVQFANVYHSSHAADELAKSQLYHCDSDEVTQVKIFVFCEDVTPEAGPLTVVPADLSQRVRDHVHYKYKKRLSDEQVREALGDDLVEVPITGPAGTVVFVDTSRCLHFGSRISTVGVRRLVVMLQYVTPLAFILPEHDFHAGAAFRHLLRDDHDAVTALLLGGR
jgi:hypothetical protein